MSRRRRNLFLLTVGIVLTLVAILVFGREREPRYEGKKLSEWVDLYPSLGLSGDAQLAERGVRGIGTNGIPFLLKWLEYESSPTKQKVYVMLNKGMKRIGLPFDASDRREQARAYGAAQALIALGPDAYGTINELVHVMYDPKTSKSASQAVHVLRALVFESKDWRLVPVLKEMLHDPNPKVREFAAHGLRVIGSPVAEAKP